MGFDQNQNRVAQADSTRFFYTGRQASCANDVVLNSYMLKIEVELNGAGPLIRLIGRIRQEHLEALSATIAGNPPNPTLDLREVTLVDLYVVRFLLRIEHDGVELKHCPPFIREWIEREASAGPL